MVKSSQLVLLKETPWNEQGFPTTDIETPLYLFNRENNNIVCPKEPAQSMNAKACFARSTQTNMFTISFAVRFPPFSASISVENDAAIAKQCCSAAYGYKRRSEEAARSYKLMHASVKGLT